MAKQFHPLHTQIPSHLKRCSLLRTRNPHFLQTEKLRTYLTQTTTKSQELFISKTKSPNTINTNQITRIGKKKKNFEAKKNKQTKNRIRALTSSNWRIWGGEGVPRASALRILEFRGKVKSKWSIYEIAVWAFELVVCAQPIYWKWYRAKHHVENDTNNK